MDMALKRALERRALKIALFNWSKATGKLMHRQAHQQQKEVMINNYQIFKYPAGIKASKHIIPYIYTIYHINTYTAKMYKFFFF